MSRYGHLDMNQLYSMWIVARSSEDESWANEVRQEAMSRPESERRAWERYGTDPG